MPQNEPVLAVAAIVKNEVAYLLEWIAYHRVLGVSRFFIADNASSDGTTQLLAQLHRSRIIKAISVVGENGKPPQLPAYAAIIRMFSGQAQWIAFIDADEFLFPSGETRSLMPVIRDFDGLPDVGAIAANWATYGSSGLLCAGSGLVMERFQRRGEQGEGVNQHYKSIVRTSACQGTGSNAHFFSLKEGFRTLTTDKQPVRQGWDPGVSDAVCWNSIRINHYVIKSYEEYLFRKKAKGRPDMAEWNRDQKFFKRHDLNDIHDPMPEWLVSATKDEMNRIMKVIASRPGTG